MALTFPLSLADFADRLRIRSAPFVLEEQQELSIDGGGFTWGAQLAPSRWTALVTLRPERFTVARAIQARIEALTGPVFSFYLYCPTNCYPAADPGGVVLGASAVTIQTVGGNNKSLSLAGLPALYQLRTGDALAFNYGSNPVRRAWHRLAEDVAANGAGATPLVELSHALRPGVTAGLSVTLKKPAAKMFIVPRTLSVSDTNSHRAISFQVAQRP